MTVDFRGMLREAAEPDLAEFSSKLTPGKQGIMGVRVPVIRNIARQVVKDGWEQILDGEPESFEEEMLRGVVIATAPVAAEERIRLTEDFLGYVDNWATCDIFCNSWKFRKGESDLVWDYFSSLIDSGQEYRMRVSIIARMSLFKDEEHCRILLEDIATHDNPGYYYRMGAAWAVSMVYVDHPGIAEDLIRSGRMEAWTHNKSIQKIRESRRVPKEKKEELGAFRRTAP